MKISKEFASLSQKTKTDDYQHIGVKRQTHRPGNTYVSSTDLMWGGKMMYWTTQVCRPLESESSQSSLSWYKMKKGGKKDTSPLYSPAKTSKKYMLNLFV